MSWKCVEWAKSWTSELSSPEAFVLFIIAEHFNETKLRAWPSTETICNLTRYGRSTVFAAIKGLEAKGMVVVEPRFGAHGRSLSSQFCIPLYDERSVPLRSRTPRGKQESQDHVASRVQLLDS